MSPEQRTNLEREQRLDAIRRAVAELEEGRRRLATARSELDDPRLVMEMQRLLAERQKMLDLLVGSIRRSPQIALDDVSRTPRSASRSAVQLGAAAGGDDSVMSAVVRGETSAIDVLRDTIHLPLPAPVDAALRETLTQIGKSRDQLELVAN